MHFLCKKITFIKLVTDISWVDYPYTASTCNIMYRRQHRPLYYGGENLKYYTVFDPTPRSSPFIGGQR
jgi:hypothetical protein